MGVLRHTISQNIDNLHFVAGSVAVTEIHGNRTKVRCVECGARWPWDEFVAIAAASTQHTTDTRPEMLAELGGVTMRMPPECPQCAGIVKSDTVMFGEPIPREFLAECYQQAELADCCIIAGTSAAVVPAAYFPEIVLRAGGTIVEVNTDDTPFTPHAAAVLRGPAGEMLPALVEALERLRVVVTDASLGPEGVTRFIVLCGPRTGSNMLTSALHSHPRIVCFREIFNFTFRGHRLHRRTLDRRDPDDIALRKADAPRSFGNGSFVRIRRSCAPRGSSSSTRTSGVSIASSRRCKLTLHVTYEHSSRRARDSSAAYRSSSTLSPPRSSSRRTPEPRDAVTTRVELRGTGTALRQTPHTWMLDER